MFVCAIASLLNALCLTELLRRITKAEREVAGVSFHGSAADVGFTIRDFCGKVIGAHLLPGATVPGLSALPVRFRLHNDPFSRVGELLESFNGKGGGRTVGDVMSIVRRFYQLAYSLDASPEDEAPVLDVLERKVIENDGSRKVGRVARVGRGQAFDAQTMTYLRNGTHVAQPFGFIVYSPEGKVIVKAEVLCR